MNKKIYFAGSIRGGREDAALYQRIIQYINKTDVVLKQKSAPRPLFGLGALFSVY
jgi:hypothetical protein